MFRKAHMLLASFALCGLLLARGAEAQGFGYVDNPQAGQTVSGVVSVSGWAVDFRQIDKVELYLDGIFVNRADTNHPRADVYTVFPAFSLSPNQNPGWLTSFVSRFYTSGPHALSVKVTTTDQSFYTIGPITVILDNSIGAAALRVHRRPGAAGIPGSLRLRPGRGLGSR